MAISQKNELRRRILDAARKLLLERGIAQVSIRMIATNVGCSVGAIYTYFENKDILIHSLIEEGFDRLVNSQLSIEAAVLDPVERLKALCRNYVHFGLKNPEYYEIMFHLNAERMARYPVEKYRKARRNLEIISRAIQENTDLGTVSVSEPFLGAHLIWSLLHGLVTLIQFERIDRKIDRESLIESAITQAVNLSAI